MIGIEFSLSDLAFSVYVFDSMTKYTESYCDFRSTVGHNLDLNRHDHRQELIIWLNRWGCRQFALDQRQAASENIAQWYERVAGKMLDCDREIWELNDRELERTEALYSDLFRLTASFRKRGSQMLRVTVGPTGASKILFALRPRAYLPWDIAIRRSLGYGNDGKGYVDYLLDVGQALRVLERSCVETGSSLKELPSQLGKPEATIPALVNAYIWVVHSQGVRPPDRDQLRQWAKWSS